MNFSLYTALLFILLTAQAQAHEHPGIDSLTHSLEHLALSYQIWLISGLAALSWTFAFVVGVRKWLKMGRRKP